MSEPTGSANLVSATSGTERKRGFVGIVSCQREPLHHPPPPYPKETLKTSTIKEKISTRYESK